MKFKKITLSIIAAILTTTTFSDDFLVIIEKDQFLVGGGKPSYTPWTTVSSNCSVDKNEQDVYFNYPFTQKETCEETQERIKTTYLEDGSELKEKETQKITTNSETDLVGTYMADQCSSISGTSYDYGNGYYTLDRGNKNPDVYCDMSDGGWTFYLIPLNSQNDWKNVNWYVGWTPSPGFGFTNYTDINNKCLNETGLDTYADYTSSSNTYWYKARNFLKNETNYFSSHPTAGDGAGIALGLKWTGSKWVNFKNGSTSIISPDSADAGDNCTGNLQVCGFWDARDNHSNYGYGAGAEDWEFPQTEGVLCGGKL